MKKYLFYILTVTISSLITAESKQDDSCAQGIVLYQKAWRESEDYSWLPLEILRSYEASCNDDSEYRLYYSQMRATLESKVGNHRDALVFNDWRGNDYYTKEDLPPSVRAAPALPYIVEHAAQTNFVVVNERHHVGSDRLLTLELLEPLYAHGFRYLAVETLGYWDEINERGYPVASSGYYSNEVVFGQMLRTALQLGFEVVSYEIENSQWAPEDPDDPVNRQIERDLTQAQNIVARTTAKDASARVLIHCGYGHVRETKSSNWSPMAYFLKELTKADPLTIDQVEFSERSTLSQAHPWRQEADKRGLLNGSPFVLLDLNGTRIDTDSDTDIEVFGLRTHYEHGRPSWMRMGGTREPVWFNTPECVEQVCIVEAMDPHEDDHAVPYDRIEANHIDRVVLFLPPNRKFDIRILDLQTNTLAVHSIDDPVSSTQ